MSCVVHSFVGGLCRNFSISNFKSNIKQKILYIYIFSESSV